MTLKASPFMCLSAAQAHRLAGTSQLDPRRHARLFCCFFPELAQPQMQELISWARDHGALFEAVPHPQHHRQLFAARDLTPGGKARKTAVSIAFWLAKLPHNSSPRYHSAVNESTAQHPALLPLQRPPAPPLHCRPPLPLRTQRSSSAYLSPCCCTVLARTLILSMDPHSGAAPSYQHPLSRW